MFFSESIILWGVVIACKRQQTACKRRALSWLKLSCCCAYCQTHWGLDLQNVSCLLVTPVVVVELQQHGCVYSFTVILLGHAVWPCGEHRHKMLYKYRPQHWLSVSAPLSAGSCSCVWNWTSLLPALLFEIHHVLLHNHILHIMNICNSVLKSDFLLFLSCRWRKWLPHLNKHRIPAGAISGKYC